MELLKQPQANPYPIEDQVASIWMARTVTWTTFR